MTFRTYLILFFLSLIPPIVIAQFQPIPGYLDSDYYYAGGIQLVTGKGFTEPYLWNYLDGTTSLPHPSHSYWMPLASIVAALGMWVTGQTTHASARLFFILIAALVSPLTAYLAYRFTQKQELAITSGIFAIFSVYSAPFVGVTDNFSLFMLFGVLYFIFASQLTEDSTRKSSWFFLGLLAGFMTLSRSDGLLWIALTFLFALWRAPKESFSKLANFVIRNCVIALVGFLLIMSPWYIRNFNAYGTFMTPGGSRALWLANYDETFIFPPSRLTLTSFLSHGWKNIWADRMWALSSNLQSGFAAHGGIILFPFIVAGIIAYRKDDRVKLAAFAWCILFLVMTFLFPFAGARGAFFHAGASLQPMWWVLAPLGLEAILASLRKRNWGNDQTKVIFRSALVMITMILTVFVVYLRIFSLGWGEGQEDYPAVERFLSEKGIQPSDVVIVRNAPGYYLQTRRSAVSIPYSGGQTILAVSKQFHANYLVLEPEAEYLAKDVTDFSQFIYLGELDDGTKLYKIENE
ncbi:MAG: glycosyltransferase family 39 protein [Anaerolineales bacterium]